MAENMAHAFGGSVKNRNAGGRVDQLKSAETSAFQNSVTAE
jgi:hypothetical protein